MCKEQGQRSVSVTVIFRPSGSIITEIPAWAQEHLQKSPSVNISMYIYVYIYIDIDIYSNAVCV